MPGEVEKQSQRAWLAMTKQSEDYRRLGGGVRYDDDPTSHYSWDSNVPNSRQVSVGDILVFWDQRELLGASVIEDISERPGIKSIGRCPNCNKTNYLSRKKIKPRFRCYDCGAQFENPNFTETVIVSYRSSHNRSWVDLAGVLTGEELRGLCFHRHSQNSIRELHLDDFKAAVGRLAMGNPLQVIEACTSQIVGGHLDRVVRVRVGQAGFRATLLREYGHECAFTGTAPPAVLEACHLYNYASVGQHDVAGGLILRRDVHRLFDTGLLAVDKGGKIDVEISLLGFPIYAKLHGKPVLAKLKDKQSSWLRLHWNQWR
ncbi:HNH endonuclease [Rhodococcus sp. 06-418-5]|uniref:HNH endonuclease n=1 Tax=Rhodococcus sp. 06-418-5 TaxID=2022507 RepID=UPI0015C64A52|nr:HNH endonuclease signature motif containing protein [Rhodococcus sp. 06-418-5]